MKRKLIIVAVLIIIFLASVGICKSNLFSNTKEVEFNESNDITEIENIEQKEKNDLPKEEIKQELITEETKEVIPEKQETKQQTNQKQNNNNKPKQEIKTNSNSNNTQTNITTQTSSISNNNENSGVIDSSGNGVREEKIKTVDNEPWVKAGVSKDDYYNKPGNYWMRVDYSIELGECVSINDCESQCNKDAEERSATEDLSCIQVFTYSGRYLGEMLKKD